MSTQEIDAGKVYVTETVRRVARELNLELTDLIWGGDPPAVAVILSGKRQVLSISEEDLEDSAADIAVRSRLGARVEAWLRSKRPAGSE